MNIKDDTKLLKKPLYEEICLSKTWITGLDPLVKEYKKVSKLRDI